MLYIINYTTYKIIWIISHDKTNCNDCALEKQKQNKIKYKKTQFDCREFWKGIELKKNRMCVINWIIQSQHFYYWQKSNV